MVVNNFWPSISSGLEIVLLGKPKNGLIYRETGKEMKTLKANTRFLFVWNYLCFKITQIKVIVIRMLRF
jgi:hypothetical protein